jgi:cation diffusion facilitator CzcD-associated flavoprotein CzcO
MPAREVDVAIIGAGPYGLSIAAHLSGNGVSFRVFGDPMRSWLDMARGMYLKSFGFATRVYTPQGSMSFVEYCRDRGLEWHEPCAIADFARYGIWLQKQVVPEVEQVEVTGVATADDRRGFHVTLASGEPLLARQVVVAVGLKYFPRLPEALAGLPPTLVSHTSQHDDYAWLAGKDVCVIGAGQSALEAAALLKQGGARPHLLVRQSRVLFLGRMSANRSLWERLRAPQSGLGPGMKSWLLETFPAAMHYAPRNLRLNLVRRHLGPSGAWWLRDRVEGQLPIHTRCVVREAVARGDRVLLRVHDEGQGEREIEADHVVAGSGFEVDVDRLTFLAPELRARIRRIEKAPALNRRFESSVAGLFFVGPAAANSFGPLLRFVAGAAYVAPTVARHLTRRGSVPAQHPGQGPHPRQ